jgi:hypothetical protein
MYVNSDGGHNGHVILVDAVYRDVNTGKPLFVAYSDGWNNEYGEDEQQYVSRPFIKGYTNDDVETPEFDNFGFLNYRSSRDEKIPGIPSSYPNIASYPSFFKGNGNDNFQGYIQFD